MQFMKRFTYGLLLMLLSVAFAGASYATSLDQKEKAHGPPGISQSHDISFTNDVAIKLHSYDAADFDCQKFRFVASGYPPLKNDVVAVHYGVIKFTSKSDNDNIVANGCTISLRG
jgi:hypothetical protein